MTRMSNTTTQAAPFAKVFSPSEKGWSMVIGESVTYFNSMREAVIEADAHNKKRLTRPYPHNLNRKPKTWKP